MTTLYGHPVSQPCRSAQWYIEYAGKDVKIQNVDIMTGENKKPEYTSKFPAAQVPGLEVGDFCLAESIAILQYLAAGDDIMPKDKKDVARLNEYLGRHFSAARKFTLDVIIPFVFAKEDKEQKVAAGMEAIKPHLERYNTILGEKQYLLGDKLSLADFMFAPEVDQLVFVDKDIFVPYPNIKAYLSRLDGVTGYTNSFEGAKKALGF